MSNLLFKSGFESATVLDAVPAYSGTNQWQQISGTDASTGQSWGATIWGGEFQFQLITDAVVNEVTVYDYIGNEIVTMTGRRGTSTKALRQYYQNPTGGGAQQCPFMLLPSNEPGTMQGEMYYSYWLKLRPDLETQMEDQTWKMVWEMKTSGDFRAKVELFSWEAIASTPAGQLCISDNVANGIFWGFTADNNANGGLPFELFWQRLNCAVPVPLDEWFKMEVYFKRNGTSPGRFWAACNGVVLIDTATLSSEYQKMHGENSNELNRIFTNMYIGSHSNFQDDEDWKDDLELWDEGFPIIAMSNLSAGSEISGGRTGASVSSNRDFTTTYYAVLSNGGSCTKPQLIAGAGGNILVAGNKHNIHSGSVTFNDIAGLTPGEYELVAMQVGDEGETESEQIQIGFTQGLSVVHLPIGSTNIF